ncbi:MAG: metallophosphoesterase [Pseudolabrys sp.]
MASRPILITQISDLHITRPGALAYGRVDTATALLRTISTLNGLSPRPDLVVISGDIADSALPEEYAHATKLLGALKVPFVAIPGNHDRRPLMRESFPDSAYGEPGWALNKVRRVNGLDIVLIDSTVAGAAHGELDQRSNGLTAHSRRRQHDRHSCFCTIHRSTRASCTRTPCGCGTPDALATVLKSHARVLLLAAGHVHRAAQTVFTGISASICSAGEQAVTLEFEPRWAEVFRVEPPAFHLHAWLSGPRFGSVVTRVLPVGEFPGPYSYGSPIRRRVAYKRLFLGGQWLLFLQ